LPVFRFDKAFAIARSVRSFLSPKTAAHGAGLDTNQYEKEIQNRTQELHSITTELRAAKVRGERPKRLEQMKSAKRKKQEIFQLKMKLRTTEEQSDGEPETGALPDFAVVGGAKCGTTFFYHLLTLHPHVEPTAMKETHFFDRLFDEGIDWYRGCFPKPQWKDGQRTITGDGTPGYLFHPLVPERMARVVPQVRLIALLRNPVERTYSAYHHRVRNGSERRTFAQAVEEAMEAEKARRPGELREFVGDDNHDLDKDVPHGFLFNCIYVDHLLRWSEYFDKEQMLVLKSEDFFENPSETLKPVLSFLDLPDWEPGASELPEKRKNKGGYEQAMDPVVKRRLQEFFEPHNRRLYEYLGVDFGW
jgi:hypothetical protein